MWQRLGTSPSATNSQPRSWDDEPSDTPSHAHNTHTHTHGPAQGQAHSAHHHRSVRAAQAAAYGVTNCSAGGGGGNGGSGGGGGGSDSPPTSLAVRREKNRLAAKRCRERKHEQLRAMEEELLRCRTANASLAGHVEALVALYGRWAQGSSPWWALTVNCSPHVLCWGPALVVTKVLCLTEMVVHTLTHLGALCLSRRTAGSGGGSSRRSDLYGCWRRRLRGVVDRGRRAVGTAATTTGAAAGARAGVH